MTLCNVKPWIQQAQREGFALGAFNANTMEQVQAIVQAAQAENAPVIVQVSHNALRYIGGENTTLGLHYIAEIGKIAAQSVDVPVALHLDHANETEVLQALALGFTSVMFDGGDLPLVENITTTRKLSQIAHSLGAFIEAEVGAGARRNPPRAPPPHQPL
jgi:fructose-bisphosphate aldolase class II